MPPPPAAPPPPGDLGEYAWPRQTPPGDGYAARDVAGFSLLGDEPVAVGEQDALGATETAERLCRLLVSSRHSTPFTLAVDGGWGMGKSSLMRLTDRRLRAERGVSRVWYNAWTASGSGGDVLEGLIKSVLTGLDPNVLRRGLNKLRGNRPLAGALRALLTAAAGLFQAAGPVNELWNRMSADARTRNEMRNVLRRLVDDWAQRGPSSTGGRLLVVFIDDLDRCSEETVLAVCEALKLYLDVPGLAFVIGCDRSALAPGGLLRDLSPAASAFMEKIFQTVYRVPAAADRDITAYVERCARHAGISAYLDGDLTRLLIERSGRNPRRIKRLVNGFVLEATLNPAWRDFGPQAVLRVLLLQYFYADFYRMMTVPRAPSERDTLTEFRDYRLLRALANHPPDAAGPPAEDTYRMTAQLAYHEVAFSPAALQDALPDLERRLPADFPRLAADRGFTSLLDELLALDGTGELVARLQLLPVPVPVPDPEPESSYGLPQSVVDRAFGLDERPNRRRYAGMRVLWVDDHPGNIEVAGASFLRRSGADVLVAGDEDAADEAIAAFVPHVIVSDIQRGREREAGFDYVRRLRAERTYTGPVVYYSSEATAARLAKAREVGALDVTVEFGDLLMHLDAVMAGLPSARTAPPAHPSDGRPR
ncbi:P-loop NTPase fold protein [Actinacidiphila bryophytorum]|uniref:P-loop NTPase fold protein n=1 Tax=Actinacidiphila bryophytorum TaxID=1436133 RepID=UPI0021769CC8|nr:P-loop NTPase fold protein [Actinacidiphila bryophytorum]UWE12521.1 P-loop NTPase fold protein [Actinacidiphila bryophytorum]